MFNYFNNLILHLVKEFGNSNYFSVSNLIILLLLTNYA